MDESALDSLRGSGAPPEIVELKRAELRRFNESQQVEIWPEHWHATALFFAMGSQWNMLAGMDRAVYLGLRYDVLDIVEARLPPLPPDIDKPAPHVLFEQLQHLEREALQHLNDR